MPATPGFTLDPRLVRDAFPIARLELSHVLLMDNAEIPWVVLVPETSHTELCDLEPAVRKALESEIDRVSLSLRREYPQAKLNVAAIGNIVRQLHVHVVARHEDDYLWPGVVWGQAPRRRYEGGDIDGIAARLALVPC